jgi:hypothetical protein
VTLLGGKHRGEDLPGEGIFLEKFQFLSFSWNELVIKPSPLCFFVNNMVFSRMNKLARPVRKP